MYMYKKKYLKYKNKYTILKNQLSGSIVKVESNSSSNFSDNIEFIEKIINFNVSIDNKSKIDEVIKSLKPEDITNLNIIINKISNECKLDDLCIMIAKTYFSLIDILKNSTNKLIILIPGNSGYKQMKVIELLINNSYNERLFFKYFPLTKVRDDSIYKPEFISYIKNTIDTIKSINTSEKINFIIYDFSFEGHTINSIKHVLSDYNSNIIELGNVIPLGIYIESEDEKLLGNYVHRCQPIHSDITKQIIELNYRDMLICNFIIFSLYYNVNNLLLLYTESEIINNKNECMSIILSKDKIIRTEVEGLQLAKKNS